MWNFGPLNNHIITKFSWVVTMVPTALSTDILRWPVTSQWPSSRRVWSWRICHTKSQKLILGLCNIKEWWIWHRSHTLARFGRNFVCHLTYLPISPQWRPRFELSYAVTSSNQSNSKLYVQKNNYVPKPPVEPAQWYTDSWRMGRDTRDLMAYTPVGQL